MHIRSLDGLRGIAAYIVLISHLSNETDLLGTALGYGAGQIGVMIFFVLSGFLMGHLYFRKDWTPHGVLQFFRRRAARILPLYYLLVLLSVGLILIANREYWLYDIQGAAIWKNLFLIKGSSVMWTITVEASFYLVFPVLWLLYQRVGTFVTIAVLVALIVMPSVLYSITTPGIADIWSLPYVINFFAAGLCVSVLIAPSVSTRHRHMWNAGFVLSVLGVMYLYPNIGHVVPLEADGVTIEATIRSIWSHPVYMTVVIALLVTSIRSSLARFILGSGPMVWLGQISYSVYLLHMPFIGYFGHLPILTEAPWLFVIVVQIAVLIAAHLVYRFIERPARDLVNELPFPGGRGATAQSPHSPAQ